MLRDRPRRGDLSTRDRKQALREAALLKRRSLAPRQLAQSSSSVIANLLAMPEYRSAELIISYCAKEDEVHTKPVIKDALWQGKRVAAIVTDVPSKTLSFSEIESFDEDLVLGAFGILEPKPGLRRVSVNDADIILVPLVAWDEEGHRLGYGAGYFDRALEGAKDVLKVGLALESQRLQKIPSSRYDVSLDVIVTEKRVVRSHK